MKIAHKIETYTSDGEPVLRFTVMNSSGVYMEFTNWGARWITASVPDVQGALDNVLIGSKCQCHCRTVRPPDFKRR